MRLKLSLKQTWTGLILFVVIFPVSILMVWYGRQLYNNQLKSALSIEHLNNELIVNRMESEIKRFKTLLKNKSDPLALLVDKTDNPDAVKDINRLLNFIVDREEAIHEVMILSREADVIAAVDPGINVMGDLSLSAEELQSVATHWGFAKRYEYPEIVIPSMGRDYISVPKKHEGSIAFIMATPIGDPAKAVLAAKINVEKLWTANIHGEHGVVEEKKRKYILDTRGVLITEIDGSDQKPGDLMTYLAIARVALINEEWPMATSYIGVIDKPVYGTVAHVPLLNWALVSEVSISTITGPIWELLSKIIFLTLFVILAFIWFALYLAGKTLKPIQHTCAAINYVAKGNYEFVLEPSLIRELDDMITDFSNMVKARQAAEIELMKFREELELKVVERTRGLEAVNKELESFCYSVSHDMRAPLRAIDGFSQALLEDYFDKLDEQGKDFLGRIHGGTVRMGKLIDDLLQLSRLTRGEIHREEVDLSALAEKIAVELRETEPGRRVEFTVTPDLTTTADPHLLTIVLENLLGNAWKFTGKSDLARIEFGSTLLDGETVFYVRDDGAGFDKAYADKLFAPFQRLHSEEEFPGSGVGLATVQRIIYRHGGRLWAEGAVDKGAIFYFTLKP